MSDAEDITFPPLMWGEEAPDSAFDHAVMRATLGCDAGLISYKLGAAQMEAALVFAPEVPLSKAIAMLPLCGVGFQNALGALAPPEVAVHLDWWGGIRVNGARCGRFRAMASETEPTAVPGLARRRFHPPPDTCVRRYGPDPGRNRPLRRRMCRRFASYPARILVEAHAELAEPVGT